MDLKLFDRKFKISLFSMVIFAFFILEEYIDYSEIMW